MHDNSPSDARGNAARLLSTLVPFMVEGDWVKKMRTMTRNCTNSGFIKLAAFPTRSSGSVAFWPAATCLQREAGFVFGYRGTLKHPNGLNG